MGKYILMNLGNCAECDEYYVSPTVVGVFEEAEAKRLLSLYQDRCCTDVEIFPLPEVGKIEKFHAEWYDDIKRESN